MKIAVIGCGWLGERVAKHLLNEGFEVLVTATSHAKLNYLNEIFPETHLLKFGETTDFSFLEKVDVAIFSMPSSRNDWHHAFKELSVDFKKAIYFSSTGIYPDKKITFTEAHQENFREDLQLSEETIRKKFPQTNILRLAGLIGDERKLINFFKNRKPANPEKAANHIHYEDICAAVDLILQSDFESEVYNLVAPEHPTLAEILNNENSGNKTPQRIISGEKFIQNFNYKFIHSNPLYFSK